MTGYAIGSLLGLFVLPAIIIFMIGCIQYVRTKNHQKALKSALSWWSIGLSIVCLLLSLFARFANTF